MAENDRDVLFTNESFLIGILQAVSGGSLVAGLSQLESLVKLAGKFPFLFFLTAMCAALVTAVLAAYWKHWYKVWDIKGRVSHAKGINKEAADRSQKANTDLEQMRSAMRVSVALIAIGFVVLVSGFWYRAL